MRNSKKEDPHSQGKGWKWTHTDGPKSIHWWWAFIGSSVSVCFAWLLGSVGLETGRARLRL